MIILFLISFWGCSNQIPPEEPIIYGVEEGGIYNTGVEIEIEAQRGINYIASIDGKHYELGTLFLENGKHLLVVTAVNAKNQLSNTKRIHFEIDTIPPSSPRVKGIDDGKVYNRGVRIEVIEVLGQSYDALINGQPYELGTEFSVEGSHVFEIKTIKERNQLTSTREVRFLIDFSRYTKEEIEYFFEIAFGSEYGGESNYLKKWIQDIKIKVIGAPNDEDLENLKQVMEELADLTGLQFLFDNKDPNITMYFIPHGEFKKHADPAIAEANWGLFWYFEGMKGQIVQAKILVEIDQGDQSSRNHLVREELTQSLGLGQDSWRYYESIFFQGYTITEFFTDIDRQIIKMLYDPNIPPNAEREMVEVYFTNKLADSIDDNNY